MHPPVSIAGPLSLGDLLDRTFRLYRARFSPLVITAALFLVPMALVSGLATGTFMVSYLDLAESISTGPDEAEFGQFLTATFGYTGLIMLLWIATVIGNGMVALSVASHGIAFLHGEHRTVKEGIRIGVGRFWAFLGMTVLRGLAFAGITVLALGLTLGAGFGLSLVADLSGFAPFVGDSPAGVVALILAVLCFYLFFLVIILGPMVYLSTRWIAAMPGLVDQRLGPVACLHNSWWLTSGHFWRCLGYTVLLAVLGFVVFSVPSAVIQQLMLLVFPNFVGPITALSAALSSIFGILWQPLYALALVFLYYDLRVRRQSYDLQLRLEEIEAGVQADGGIDQQPI